MTDWRTRAACLGHDPEMWDPARDRSESATDYHQRIAAVRAICRTCPVAAECVDAELATGQQIWLIRGGKTPNQLARIRRQRARTVKETA